MISFMVIGLPRSGTAWAANWLTNWSDLCCHDPLFNTALEDLDSRCVANGTGMAGIADTGIWRFPEFLAKHPATKVILHRDQDEIDASLDRAGLPRLRPGDWLRLNDVSGLHVHWSALFQAPDMIYFNLFRRHMIDWEYRRHELLCKLNVQVDFEKVDPDPVVTRRMLDRMRMDAR